MPIKIEKALCVVPRDADEIPVKIPETETEAQNQTSPADSREMEFFSFNLISPLQDTKFMREGKVLSLGVYKRYIPRPSCPKISYINSYFAKEDFITEI